MIACKNIHLQFEDRVIFNDLNLHINKGEHVCLKGESGKGKSTLLKLFQGYIVPEKGTIEINGSPISHITIDQIRDQIIWIPQNINLPANSGIELIELMNLQKNIPNIEKLMQNLGLDINILSKYFQNISVGQKQRIVLAICLSIEKPIILMDEPTSALDSEAVDLLKETINNLKDKTIVSASHATNWLEFANRNIVL